jgi:periplasmic divalent cation tolerance protein
MTAAQAERAALIWCPFPDRETARGAIAALLDEKLVACANILGEIESHFLWQGTQDSALESGVLFKTTTARLEEAVAHLGKLHPYDTPAIVGWAADAALPETIAWLASVTRPE